MLQLIRKISFSYFYGPINILTFSGGWADFRNAVLKNAKYVDDISNKRECIPRSEFVFSDQNDSIVVGYNGLIFLGHLRIIFWHDTGNNAVNWRYILRPEMFIFSRIIPVIVFFVAVFSSVYLNFVSAQGSTPFDIPIAMFLFILFALIIRKYFLTNSVFRNFSEKKEV